MLRGKAATLAILVLATSLSYTAIPGLSNADDPHGPIRIVGDAELQNNVCACVRNPGAAGTPSDPFIISDWRVQNAFGIAVEIRDIRNLHFVLRDNSLEGKTGVLLANTGDRGKVENNAITHSRAGINLVNSSPRVVGNIIQATTADPTPYAPIGISTDGGSPLIKANTISRSFTGILAEASSPRIVGNELVENRDAVVLSDSTDALLQANTIRLAQHWGLVVERSAKARLIDNDIVNGDGGVVVDSATLYMESNRVTNQNKEAVRFTDAVVTMFRNTVSDNWRGAAGSTDSHVLIRNNTFTNNQQEGVRITRSTGEVVGNTVERNGVGISIQDAIITLEDNVLENNRFGFSIPFTSAQTVNLMENNWVNGINVDGTVNAADKRIFFGDVGVSLTGQTFDSGHGDGFRGTLFEQGVLVFYDTTDVTVRNNLFEYNHRAITVQKSVFVRIEANTFHNNDEAVVTIDSRTFIKENECDIEIDPEATVCFEVIGSDSSSFASVRGNLVVGVEVGIRLDTRAEAIVESNTVQITRVGIEAKGFPLQNEHQVKISFNAIRDNRVGVELITFHGTLQGNLIANNTWAGVHLSSRTNATLVHNQVIFNGAGIVDVDVCTDSNRNRCSGGVFVENRVRGNAGVGIEVHNGGLFQGDTVINNQAGIRTQGTATLHAVDVRSNARIGLDATGRATVRAGNFTHNGQDGIRVQGHIFGVNVNATNNSGDGLDVTGRAVLRGGNASDNNRVGLDLRGSGSLAHGNFSANAVAGLRLNVTVVRLFDCEVSFNGDGVLMAEVLVDVHVGFPDVVIPEVPTIEAPGIPSFQQDPLWMSECNLVGNDRFALSASVDSVVNATFNFWGKQGPVYHVPLHQEPNSINAVAPVSPYFTDREHRNVGFQPTTTAGPDDRVI